MAPSFLRESGALSVQALRPTKTRQNLTSPNRLTVAPGSPDELYWREGSTAGVSGCGSVGRERPPDVNRSSFSSFAAFKQRRASAVGRAWRRSFACLATGCVLLAWSLILSAATGVMGGAGVRIDHYYMNLCYTYKFNTCASASGDSQGGRATAGKERGRAADKNNRTKVNVLTYQRRAAGGCSDAVRPLGPTPPPSLSKPPSGTNILLV